MFKFYLLAFDHLVLIKNKYIIINLRRNLLNKLIIMAIKIAVKHHLEDFNSFFFYFCRFKTVNLNTVFKKYVHFSALHVLI